jgi:hypothetical protein
LLSVWVTQDYNDGFEIVLLSGVAVKESLSLHGGICLTPIEVLPDRLPGYSLSQLTEARCKLAALASFDTPFTYTFHCLLPSAALVRPMKFRPQTWDSGNPPKIKSEDPPLDDLCWCFAALESCWPQPHTWYSVLADSVPAADLLGMGSLQPQPHYALGDAPPPLQEEDRARAQSIFQRFNALEPKRREPLLPALEWLSLAKRRARVEQRFVDLAIVLESLFTRRRERPKSWNIQTRASERLGANEEERCKIKDLIKELYDIRSDIVHGGRIKEWRTRLHGEDVHRAHIIPDATRLCERAVHDRIEAPTEPDWVLGPAAHTTKGK